jgi:hypothetical protein
MRKWMNLFEKAVSHKDYDLAAKFDHFNQLCFNGALPRIPCQWQKLKRATGRCHIPFSVPAQYAKQPRIVRIMHGQVKWEGVYIALDRQYIRDEKDLDAVLVHEMIHAWFAFKNDLLEEHGSEFLAKLKKCEQLTGLTIPVTESVEGLTVADDIALNKPFVVMIVERNADILYAMMSPTVYQKIADTAPDMLRRLMRGSTVTLYGTTSEAWNKKAMTAKVQRPKSFPQTALYHLKPLELLDDLKASGKVLFTGTSD